MIAVSLLFATGAALLFFYFAKQLERTGIQHWFSKSKLSSSSKVQGKQTAFGGRSSSNSPSKDLKDNLPPSVREELSLLLSTASSSGSSSDKHNNCRSDQLGKQLPYNVDWNECPSSTVTPTGVTLGEIRQLGSFPDYAAVSGVPLPEEYKDFKIETALPRPYRPLRWSYHQTMSLSKMDKDWWIELDKDYADNVATRCKLFRDYGKVVLDYLPGSELASRELMEMVLQFCCARYPQYFQLCTSKIQGHIFHNLILGTKWALRGHHPLHILINNIPEDFAIMIRNPEDGYYYLRGGIICSSLGWTLGSKMGKQLKGIHAPVPHYREKMQFSMDRYFSKMPVTSPIQRGSWGLEGEDLLFMPPGDPHEKLRDVQSPDLDISETRFRVDWQTLRRLPLSGAIVFNFKALFTPVTEFRDEPYMPALLAKVLLDGNETIMKYKNTWHVEHVVVPALKRWEKEQAEKGLTEEGWEPKTMDESPWFPGWEEKWHRQQGF